MSKPGAKPYRWVYAPDHPRATKKGWVQEHRIIAEELLGRILKPEEVVHHIDKDTLNNNVDNLMIFAAARDHNAFHMGAPAWSADGLVWQSSTATKIKKCEYCNKLFYPHNTKLSDCKFCSTECVNKARIKHNEDRVSKIQELLYENNGNFSRVAEILGTSANGIKKLLKTRNLKFYSKDYKN